MFLVFYYIFLFFFKGSEELFLVDPLAPSGSSRSATNPAALPRFPFLAQAVRRVANNDRDLLSNANDSESKFFLCNGFSLKWIFLICSFSFFLSIFSFAFLAFSMFYE